jgi:hypothetical protein
LGTWNPFGDREYSKVTGAKSGIMKTNKKRTSILVALCLAIGHTTQCFGLDDNTSSDAKGTSSSDAKGLFCDTTGSAAGTIGGDDKGLFREPASAAGVTNTTGAGAGNAAGSANPANSTNAAGSANATNAADIDTPSLSSLKLEGGIEKRFPSPEDVFDVEAEPQTSETTSKLESIIYKSSDSEFDRLMKAGNIASAEMEQRPTETC